MLHPRASRPLLRNVNAAGLRALHSEVGQEFMGASLGLGREGFACDRPLPMISPISPAPNDAWPRHDLYPPEHPLHRRSSPLTHRVTQMRGRLCVPKSQSARRFSAKNEPGELGLSKVRRGCKRVQLPVYVT